MLCVYTNFSHYHLSLLFLPIITNVQGQYGNIWPLGKMQGIDFNGTEAKLIKTGINNGLVENIKLKSILNSAIISTIAMKKLLLRGQ